MYIFIKAQFALILTSRRYFKNKIIVVQVHLFLKEPNDERRVGRFNQCCQSSFEIVANSCNMFWDF